MEPLKIAAFAVYFFLALNIATLIVVQYAIPMKYAWSIYLGTMLIATLPCVYLIQGTTVTEIAAAGLIGTITVAAAPAALVAGPMLGIPGVAASLVGSLLATSRAMRPFGPFGPLPPLPESDDELELRGGRRGKKRRGRGRVGNDMFVIPFF